MACCLGREKGGMNELVKKKHEVKRLFPLCCWLFFSTPPANCRNYRMDWLIQRMNLSLETPAVVKFETPNSNCFGTSCILIPAFVEHNIWCQWAAGAPVRLQPLFHCQRAGVQPGGVYYPG